MTKAELIKVWNRELAEAGIRITGAESDVALKALCKIINAELLGDGEISLPHLGKLKIKRVAARTGHNPRTDEVVSVPAKRRVVFVATKELKDALN